MKQEEEHSLVKKEKKKDHGLETAVSPFNFRREFRTDLGREYTLTPHFL